MLHPCAQPLQTVGALERYQTLALNRKSSFGEGADGADVDDVARVGIVEPLTRIESQLSPVPAVENAELSRLGDLVGKAHAA